MAQVKLEAGDSVPEDPMQNIQRRADELDFEAAPERTEERKQEQDQARQADRVQDTAAELLEALQLARDMGEGAMEWWPDYGKVWSDERLKAIASSGAVVMLRHGWTLGEVMAHWGPYVALAAAVLVPGLATLRAVQRRRVIEAPAVTRPAPRPPGAQTHDAPATPHAGSGA